MLLLLGVLMTMAGLWLCFAGDINLPAQRKLGVAGARLGGALLLCFLPLVLGVRFFIDELEGLYITLINWGLAVFCLLGSLLLMALKSESTAPRRRMEPTAPVIGSTFEEQPEATTPPAVPPPTRSSRTSGSRNNPFDFS